MRLHNDFISLLLSSPSRSCLLWQTLLIRQLLISEEEEEKEKNWGFFSPRNVLLSFPQMLFISPVSTAFLLSSASISCRRHG